MISLAGYIIFPFVWSSTANLLAHILLKSTIYCRPLVLVSLVKVNFIKLTYAMVKNNYIWSGLYFLLERTHFSYNFMYFCFVFLCDFYHFKYFFRASGHMNFPNHGGSSGNTNRANLPLKSSRMLLRLSLWELLWKLTVFRYRENTEHSLRNSLF